MNIVYFSLGSSEGSRFFFLQQAIQTIEQRIGIVEKISSYYETEPWGFDGDKPFINQVIKVSTGLSVQKVLERILLIEKQYGRKRSTNSETYTNRTIDIDILFYDDIEINTENLIVPHKHIQSRKFVLEPMIELAPNFIHPILKKTIRELLLECNDSTEVKKLYGKDILIAVA